MDKEAVIGIIARLLEIQKRDVRLARYRRELEDTPRLKQEAESRLDRDCEAVSAAHAAIQERLVAVKQAEIDIESKRQQIVRLREQQLQIKTNEEFKALNRQIVGLEETIRKDEDAALELMEAADAARRTESDRKADLARAQDGVAAELKALAERRRVLEAEEAGLQQERAALSSDVPADWMALYNRILENRKDVALVGVADHACGGCHMKLPPHVIQDVKRSQTTVTCSFCGRLLYWNA